MVSKGEAVEIPKGVKKLDISLASDKDLNLQEGEHKKDTHDTSTYIIDVEIKSHKKDCITLTGPTKCMQVKEFDSKVWKDVVKIKNFDYKEGYNYLIFVEVTKYKITAPGMPATTYKLIDIIDKYLDDNNTVCTTEYKPVCGVYHSDCKIDTNDSHKDCGADEYKSFSNMCVLTNEPNGAQFAYDGECNDIIVDDIITDIEDEITSTTLVNKK